MNLPGTCEIKHNRINDTLTITFSEERLVYVRGREWIGEGRWVCSRVDRHADPLTDLDLGDLSDLLDDRDLREIGDLCEELDLAERETCRCGRSACPGPDAHVRMEGR